MRQGPHHTAEKSTTICRSVAPRVLSFYVWALWSLIESCAHHFAGVLGLRVHRVPLRFAVDGDHLSACITITQLL
jgi:hypothetical protein